MNDLARDLIKQHIPSITDRIEDLALAQERDPEAFDGDGDYVGSLRECHCGVIVEGYYEYVDHLLEVLQ